MNGNNLVVDTNIIIYLLNGERSLVNLLEGKSIYLSFITEIELLTSKKLKRPERTIIENLLSQCTIIDINSYIKTQTIDLRTRYSLKIPDAIIAATADYLSAPLITSDEDFKLVKELDLIYFQI